MESAIKISRHCAIGGRGSRQVLWNPDVVRLAVSIPFRRDVMNARITPEPQIWQVGGLGVRRGVLRAGIARGVSKNGYILDETKKWARSVVADWRITRGRPQKRVFVSASESSAWSTG